MLSGCDISNLQGPPEIYRDTEWYRVAQFVLVQGIEPPPGYPGCDFIDPETGRRGYTGVQMRAAKADGKYVGVYVWLWNGLVDTRGNILSRLSTVPPSIQLDMRPFVDVEDTTAVGLAVPAEAHDRLQRQLRCEARPS